jgi:hypothetical protein
MSSNQDRMSTIGDSGVLSRRQRPHGIDLHAIEEEESKGKRSKLRA